MENNKTAIVAALEAARLSYQTRDDGLFVEGDPDEIAGKLSDVMDELMLDPDSDLEGFLKARGSEVWHSNGIQYPLCFLGVWRSSLTERSGNLSGRLLE